MLALPLIINSISLILCCSGDGLDGEADARDGGYGESAAAVPAGPGQDNTGGTLTVSHSTKRETSSLATC